MSEQEIVPVRRMFEAFHTGDLSHVHEFISVDYLNYEALDDEDDRATRRGPEECTATVTWLRSVYTNLRFEEQEVIVAGEKVVVRSIMSGQQTGEFMGIPPTGKTVAQQQVHIFRVVNGKVVEHRAVRDDLGMLRQLGAIHFGPS